MLFDSRDETYRNPFGAVCTNRPVSFTIRPDTALAAARARLQVVPDGGEPLCTDMQKLGGDGGTDRFFCTCALGLPGLYFYDFELETPAGKRYAVLSQNGRAALSDKPGEMWQLTVYDAAFQTPAWLRGGILYQIFPDRFAKAGDFPEDLPAGRFLRRDWGGVPEYRGDEEGKYLNNTYFGGNLRGIREKLPYLKSLGVTALYLNPVFEAHSNHRYNTADYNKIDPMLGTEEDFRALCRDARALSMRVILDGVFSHTGDDSVYFNRAGRYPGPGAYQSQSSPYSGWYRFHKWPEEYDCWWGYKTLPEVDEENAGYLSFITGPGGVAEHWVRAGAAGFRLDVADELPSPFIRTLRARLKQYDPEALLIGEVWEDASRKTSYGERRPYLNGEELDSVMNYPFREAILAFLKGGSAQAFEDAVLTVLEHYPKPCVDVLMNLLGTHDTARVLTELTGEPCGNRDRAWRASHPLTPEQRERGLRLLRLAAALQFFLPGVPCVYYGDEAGMEGYNDPFSRGCYPWGNEDQSLLAFYRRLGAIRRGCPALREGGFRVVEARGGLFAFERFSPESELVCAVNAGKEDAYFMLPEGYSPAAGDILSRNGATGLGPLSWAVFLRNADTHRQ